MGNAVFLFSNKLPRLRNLEKWSLAAAVSLGRALPHFSELPLGFSFFICSNGGAAEGPHADVGDDLGK